MVPDAVIAQIPDTAARFNITTPLRLAHFLAQCGHESASFTALEENLNYSSDGLLKIFPQYFDASSAAAYQRLPIKIGARVYANRMGNGNEASGEGYAFRGRGYIQLTGKQNYGNLAGFIGEDTVATPDLVASKYPLDSAAFFFNTNSLWAICDQGSSDDTVKNVSQRINGTNGVPNGMSDRLARFKEYYSVLM